MSYLPGGGCHHCWKLQKPLQAELEAQGLSGLEMLDRLKEARCPEHQAAHDERIKRDQRNARARQRRAQQRFR